MLIIAIYTRNRGSKVTNTVIRLLKSIGSKVEILKSNENYTDRIDLDYGIIELTPYDIREPLNAGMNLKFDIFLECLLKLGESDIEKLQECVLNINRSGYFIFNSDYISKINFKCYDIYPVTYGLNGKSSVTASSINDVNLLEFSICLQRAVLTINRNIIQPFEKPIKIEVSILELNYYIAALTLMIVLGYVDINF